MAYTVKKLAKLSGVSVRTLHHYDDIGLLKPAYIGSNHYRYYEHEQLLLLQQILFYRELDISLNEIKDIVCSDNFNKIAALQDHKSSLETKLQHTEKLLQTIDKTIAHLKGRQKMKDEELYYGFDSEQQKKHEKYLVDNGIVTQEFMDECNAKVKNWSDDDKRAFIQDIERIMQGLVEAIESNMAPNSEHVQELMQQHYDWLRRSWNPDKERYLDLAELYKTPEFRKFYDSRHPKLLTFIVDAMQVYATSKLQMVSK